MNLLRLQCMLRQPKTCFSLSLRVPQSRRISNEAEYRTFPATLMRLTAGRNSDVIAKGSELDQAGLCWTDTIQVSSDGLVLRNTAPDEDPSTMGGAVFMPNVHDMQENARMMVDCYQEEDRSGSPEEVPTIYTVAKGTRVPDILKLVRESDAYAEFSLQPREPMTLPTLNEALASFHKEYSKVQDADEWLESHNYADAFNIDEEEAWMAV